MNKKTLKKLIDGEPESNLLTRLFPYRSPLSVNLYIGAPGAGKTCLAAKIAFKALRKGVPVFSNVPIIGTYEIDPKKDLGFYKIENAVIIIDEIGTCFNNRNWKTNISDDLMDWIKKYRHYHCEIHCFSQGLDFDNRFLSLAQQVYLVKKSILNVFFSLPITKIIPVRKRVDVDDETHQIIDQYFKPRFHSKLLWRPKYYKLFDTYDIKHLPEKDFSRFTKTS